MTMRTIRRLVWTAAMTTALVLGSSLGTAAQGDDAPAVSSFWWEVMGTPADMVEDEAAGTVTLIDNPVVAGDPRASGLMTSTWNKGGVTAGDEQYLVSYGMARLVNEDGAWSGPGTEMVLYGPDTRTRRQRNRGTGRPPLTGGFVTYELTGEDGYDGFTLFLHADHVSGGNFWGMILPNDTLPTPEEPMTTPEA